MLKYFASSLVFLGIFLVVCCLKFLWSRREMYRLLSNFKSLPTSSIISLTFKLIGSPTEIFKVLMDQNFEYGPNYVAWFGGHPYVMLGKPEDVEITMQSQNCLSKNYLYKFTEDVVGTGLFSAPVHKWRRNRKIITPSFNSRILENFLPIFNSCSTILVKEILPKFVKKNNVNWFEVFTLVSLDTISQTAMGINTDAQRRKLMFAKWLETCTKMVYLRFFNIFHHINFLFYRSANAKILIENRNKLHEFTDEVVRNKKEEFKKSLESKETEDSEDTDIETKMFRKKVFLDLLLDLDHKGMRFSDVELRDEVNTFFVGGTDTSSVSACFFLTMMGMHQDIQEQVYDEIIDVLGPEDKIPTMKELDSLKLLERCIKETLRIFPPAPFIVRDVVGDNVKLSDGVIPKGASIFYSIFYLHRSPLYWDEPLKFDPDRFLPENSVKRHPYNFLPFSGGLRGCIGQRYSYLNLKNLLSMIIRNYKVYCDIPSIEDIELTSFIVLRPTDGFKFYLEHRN